MKQKMFFVKDKNLIKYLKKYGRGIESKDYEFYVSLYAKSFWGINLRQEFVICFEQNDKFHKYPNSFTPTVEELKDILLTYNKENTSVDFALAPILPEGKISETAYPFQIKKFIPKIGKNLAKEFAEYINIKTNNYRDKKLCIIFVPEMIGMEESLSINVVRSNLSIIEGSVRAIYCFQFSKGQPSFVSLWISQEAQNE